MQPLLSSASAHATGWSGPAVFPYGDVDGPSRWPDTPGASRCPDCAGTTIDVQGIADCTDCDWRGRP